jgi:ribonuclease HI
MHIEPHVPGLPSELLLHTLVVDGSYHFVKRVAGIGIVHHATDRARRSGPVVGIYSEAYVGIPAHATEELALLRALEIAASHGARRVKLRCDYIPSL